MNAAETWLRTLVKHWHVWSWPMRNRRLFYPKGWDSHQTCGCGLERLYSWERMQSGPLTKMRPRL